MSGDRHLRADPDGRLNGSPDELATILVVVDKQHCASVAGQHLLQMLVNLLSRQFGVVSTILIDVADTPVHPGVFLVPRIETGELRSALLELGAQVGEPLTTTRTALNSDTPTAVILLGGGLNPAEWPVPALAVDGHGWIVRASTEGPLPQAGAKSANSLGPHLAACVAAGFAFKCAYGKQRPVELELDLWDVAREAAPELEEVVLPPAYVLGLGAVGAAFGFTLACARGIRGSLVGVDPQDVADTDVNRLLTATSAGVGEPKVGLFESLFVGGDITVHPFRGKWPADYLGAPGRSVPPQLRDEESNGRFRWVISCVDRDRDRADIATLLPRHVLAGSTIGMAAQTFYFSNLGACECLGCRHRTPRQLGVEELAEQLRLLDRGGRALWYDHHGANAQARASIEEYLTAPTCSGPGEADLARLGVQGRVDWAVGFVSVAAGVIAAARFVRIAVRGIESELERGSEERLLFWVDELSRRRAQRLSGCPMCGGALAQHWDDLWPHS